MNLTVEKARLAKGHSYALKTSTLQQMLDDAGIGCNVHVLFYQSDKLPEAAAGLDCHYWLPNANTPHSRFYVRTWSVASESSKGLSELIRIRVLPDLIKWMEKILAQPENSTSTRHDMCFSANCQNGEVHINYS